MKEFFRSPSLNRPESKEDKEIRIKEEINMIQLSLADKLCVESDQQQSFFETLKFINADVLKDIRSMAVVKNNLDFKKANFDFNNFYKKIIDDTYQADQGNLSLVYSNIMEIKKISQEEFPDIWDKWEKHKNQNSNEHRIGSLRFKEINVNSHGFNKKFLDLLNKNGFDEHSRFIELHVSPFYINAVTGIKSLQKDIADLANLIKDKYQDYDAIIGHSWLFDHPVTKKIINFEIMESDSFGWEQLINKYGQINNDRVAELMKTGKLPYKNYFGFIKISDFLKDNLK